MKDEDLEQFAVADGLVARIAAEPDHMSEAERDYLIFQGAKMLSRVTDLTGEEAYRLIYPFTEENQTTIQCGREFACISAFGRLLFVINRRELAGLCHPNATRPPGIGYHSHYLYCLGGKCSRWDRAEPARPAPGAAGHGPRRA